MEISASLVVYLLTKDELKSVLMDTGEQSVIEAGGELMLKLSADN